MCSADRHLGTPECGWAFGSLHTAFQHTLGQTLKVATPIILVAGRPAAFTCAGIHERRAGAAKPADDILTMPIAAKPAQARNNQVQLDRVLRIYRWGIWVLRLNFRRNNRKFFSRHANDLFAVQGAGARYHAPRFQFFSLIFVLRQRVNPDFHATRFFRLGKLK